MITGQVGEYRGPEVDRVGAPQLIAQMKAAHMKAVECRKLALPYLTPPGERVAIPFDGKQLYANYRKPVGIDKPPVAGMPPQRTARLCQLTTIAMARRRRRSSVRNAEARQRRSVDR